MIDSTTDKLSRTGGIALVVKILEKIGFGLQKNCTNVKHQGIHKSLVGLFVQGRTRFEEMKLFRDDDVFQNSVELDYVPTAETLRLYLEQMVQEAKYVNSRIYQGVPGAIFSKDCLLFEIQLPIVPFGILRSSLTSL